MVDSRNPYAAPRIDEVGDTFGSVPHLQDAKLGTRFLNFLLDSIFRQIAGVGGALLLVPTGAKELAMVALLLVILGYGVFFEAITGRTPAKYITGTRVVNLLGGKPTFGQILGRNLARFIPFEPLSFLGSGGRGWHDTLSGTRVVRV